MHINYASKVINYFKKFSPTAFSDYALSIFSDIKLENLNAAITYARKWVNEELLNYCTSVVSRHRPDFVANDVQLPSHITTNPSTYVDVSKIDSVLYTRQATDTKITDPVSNKFQNSGIV